MWRSWILGQTIFGDGEELQGFKYAFAMAVLWMNLPLLLMFIAADASGANPIGWHAHTLKAYLVFSGALILVLRNHPQRLTAAVWALAAASLGVHLSGFWFVPADELRLVWFYSLIAGTYILLGRRAGALITLVSTVLVATANHLSPTPVSPRGMGTFYASLVSLSVIFHVYTSRSVSFHAAMVNSQARLRHLADRDALTGLLNARSFNRQCEHLTQLAQREGTRFAVLFIDLDHFKRVNDQHGHDAGDDVLRGVASTLAQRLRKTDVLGRVGGEEFVAFLPGADSAKATLVAETLRQAIEGLKFNTLKGATLQVTASIGVAADHMMGLSHADLQRQADQAMYRAKAEGRNRVSQLCAAEQQAPSTQA